jgi:uncharacterized glyoxalase superfamily protein PhnB
MAARAEGMAWLVPLLAVSDAGRAVAFYEAAFGFTRRDLMTDDAGTVTHADMTYRDAVIMVAPTDPTGAIPGRPPGATGVASPVILYVYCDDVDLLFERATNAGAVVLQSPADMPWGDRMCSLADPDGHHWNFATHLGFGAPTRPTP